MKHPAMTPLVAMAALAAVAAHGREFVLADRDYAAPFFLGQDNPVSARSAVDAVVREVKTRSGATLKPFAVQSNPKAGYLFASVQRWTDEKAYFARIEHGILEIHGSTEEALAEALAVFTDRYVKSEKGPRLAWESVAFASGLQPDEVREREIARVRALREKSGAPDWENELVNSRNRMPSRTDNLPPAPWTRKLNGMWRHRWCSVPERRPAGFEQPGFDDSAWRLIPVPSCIEALGLNTPWYVDDYYFHPHVPPRVGCRWNPVSSYRTSFTVPPEWKGRRVYLRFNGVATAYALWVNGRRIGYSEDSQLPFEFDITSAAVPGNNLLAVEVYQFCDGEYLENNDRFRLTGIFRDVELWSAPEDGVGDWHWETEFAPGFAEATLRVASDRSVKAALYDATGSAVAAFEGACRVQKPHLWSDEDPYLYTLAVSRNGDERRCRVGFRKIEIDAEGAILVNGRRVKFRGVNRSDFSPTNGWTLTEAELLEDVRLMKRANINMVRTSHNPTTSRFYELCDEYGIYVQAEGNVESHGMGYGTNSLASPPSWSVAYAERNANQVRTFRNHPSIVMWSLGNEAGPGPNVAFARDAVLALDRSRLVMYRNDNGKFDVDGFCYMSAAAMETCAAYGKAFFLSEYAHAMGNTFGDFHTFWDEDGRGFWKAPCLTGGAIWDWADQALWKDADRAGPDGKPLRVLAYGGDWDDFPNQGNDCANGILRPDRKWNPALTEVRHAHRPVSVRGDGAGRATVWNRAAFTSTAAYDATWTLLEDGWPVASGRWNLSAVAPLEKKTVNLPETGYALKDGKEYFLNVAFRLRADTAWAEKGYAVAEDQLLLREGRRGFASAAGGNVEVVDADGTVTMRAGGTVAVFSRASGMLERLEMGGRTILSGPKSGPRVTCVRAFTDSDKWMREPFMKAGLSQLRYSTEKVRVETSGGAARFCVDLAVDAPLDRGFSHKAVWTLAGDGTLSLESETAPWGSMPTLPRFGLSLRLDDALENMEWYGRGPDENYVDRNKGTFVGRYRSTVTDQYVSYTRPQDNGYKSDVREVSFLDAEGRGVTISADRPLFVQALRHTWADIYGSRHFNAERGRFQPLVPRREVCLNLDILQTGLGMSSCGPRPTVQVRAAPEKWKVVFRPACLRDSGLSRLCYNNRDGSATLSSVIQSAQGRIYKTGEGTLTLDQAGTMRTLDVSKVDPRYFADAQDRTFVPVGCNICFPRMYANGSPESRAECEERFFGWLRKFAANGGNFTRLWLGHAFFEIMPTKAGAYDPAAEATLKKTVALCEELGIKLKLTLESFRSVHPADKVGKGMYSAFFNRPLYSSHARNMHEFLHSEKCAQIYLGKARRLKELGLGDSPAVACWELWNEINCLGSWRGNVGPWSDRMLAELRAMFSSQMTVQNLGSFSGPSIYDYYDYLGRIPLNDFMQIHRYLDPGAEQDVCRGPMDVLAADSVRELLDRRGDIPAILAEVGAVKANHTGPSELYSKDKHGMLLHDEIFAPFFAGSAGSGQPWHWDHQYIDGNDLWWHFARFADAVKGIDPAAEHFRPFRTETRRLRIWGLRGERTTLMWCRDKLNTWERELVRGEAPRTISGEKIPFCNFTCYLPWEDRWIDAVKGGVLPDFTRSIVVKIGRPPSSAIRP